MYKKIEKCRICSNLDLIPLLDLGEQYLTGVFPKKKNEKISSGPIQLVKCNSSGKIDCCGLVQLKHSFNLGEMYGDNYGYRSGLNQTMVDHLRRKVKRILSMIKLKPDDIIIDIGSNDCTLLKEYPLNGYQLIGVDPAGYKFKEYYPPHVHLISDYFSDKIIKKKFDDNKAKVITSIAMFYDLESPLQFMNQIYQVLHDDGIWILEQSYLPKMIETKAYDNICHEHLEFYCLKQIKWMADRSNLKIIDVEYNDVNGGSFSLILCKSKSSFTEAESLIGRILTHEEKKGMEKLTIYREFKEKIIDHRERLRSFFESVKLNDKLILGLGASTKGNVILQFCELGPDYIPYIAEINGDKFGCYTPGTNIPIISEEDTKGMNPDYFIVFPWHYRDYFLIQKKTFLKRGGKLVMPLPELDIIEFSSHF